MKADETSFLESLMGGFLKIILVGGWTAQDANIMRLPFLTEHSEGDFPALHCAVTKIYANNGIISHRGRGSENVHVVHSVYASKRRLGKV